MILSTVSALSPLARRLIVTGALLAAGLSVGFYGGLRWSDGALARLEAAHATTLTEIADANAAEVLKALAQGQETAAAVRRHAQESTRETNRLRLARDSAVVERDRLLDAAAEYQRRVSASCSAGPTVGGEATGVPADVRDGSRLLRVYGECVGAQDSLAFDLARTRVALTTCERSYEVIQGSSGGQP